MAWEVISPSLFSSAPLNLGVQMFLESIWRGKHWQPTGQLLPRWGPGLRPGKTSRVLLLGRLYLISKSLEGQYHGRKFCDDAQCSVKWKPCALR